MQGSNTIPWTHGENRLWNIVQERPKDAVSWSALIKFIESSIEPDLNKINAVYSGFLLSFPLSVKHRRKYANWLVQFQLIDEAIKLYDGSLWPVCGSLEFWIDYYNLVCTSKTYDDVHGLLQSAIDSVGWQYGSLELWKLCIDFEEYHEKWDEVLKLYVKLFANPVRGMETLFERCKQTSPNEDFTVYIESKKQEAKELEEKIIGFESDIKTFDFEPGLVNDAVADVWHRYITFMEKECPDKVMQTFQRSLVPCATRADLWLRYADFLEDTCLCEAAAQALEVALHYAGDGKMDILLFTAGFKERQQDVSGALHAYNSIKNYCNPVPLEVLEAHANYLHRLGNNEGAAGVFQDVIDTEATNGSGLFSPALRLKYARFALLVLENPSKVKEILTSLLNLELSTPVVAGIIDIASALPDKERAEFLDSLDDLLMRFILAGAEEEIRAEILDKRDVSLMYLQFLDNFGPWESVKAATRRHLAHFRRGNTLLPKRRLEHVIDYVISKKLKIDAGSATDKKFGSIISSLPEFLSIHALSLVEDNMLNVGLLQGHMCSRITELGRCLLRAIYKALLEQHASMLTWDGSFSAEDIILTYDATLTSIICSFRKEALRVDKDWVKATKNDQKKLQDILSHFFISTTTKSYPPYIAQLFSFVQSASSACNTDAKSRNLFLSQVAQHPVFKSPSVLVSLCRELFLYMKECKTWQELNALSVRGTSSKTICRAVTTSDTLIKKICDTTALNANLQHDYGTSWLVTIIRHIEAHATDHLKVLSMSIGGVEDLYDLVNYHFAEFLIALVMELLEKVNLLDCGIKLTSIMDKYSESD